ncbi:helix-turn-helix transcriptional regulator [Halobacillus seohaensis]|uniref:Helix-turn-helix transcriptional regulator n=1 Tax=Halobacillus seohaensis TaxID=447421 RepID=A0ABW2EKN1_9BACI
MQPETLKAIRTFNGMSREDFANQIGVSRSLVSYIEQRRCAISDETKRKLYEVYDVEYVDQIRQFTEG